VLSVRPTRSLICVVTSEVTASAYSVRNSNAAGCGPLECRCTVHEGSRSFASMLDRVGGGLNQRSVATGNKLLRPSQNG
jgi:hypothetical protein